MYQAFFSTHDVVMCVINNELDSHRIMEMEEKADSFGRSYLEHSFQSPNCSKFPHSDFVARTSVDSVSTIYGM